MNTSNDFDEHTLIDMMFDCSSIDSFQALWNKDNDSGKWGQLLHMCYNERKYAYAGGDEGYSEDPPICVERIEYLNELIDFLEKSGIKEVE